MNKPLFFAIPPDHSRSTVATIRSFLDKVSAESLMQRTALLKDKAYWFCRLTSAWADSLVKTFCRISMLRARVAVRTERFNGVAWSVALCN